MSDMNERDAAILKAVAKVIGENGSNGHSSPQSISHTLKLPGPTVINEVATPEVNITNEVKTPEVKIDVDSKGVIKAIETLADAIATQSKLLKSLVEAIAKQPPPVVNVTPNVKIPEIKIPEIVIPKIPINVEAPVVNLSPNIEIPEKERKKRRLTIRHDDGTTSELIEE